MQLQLCDGVKKSWFDRQAALIFLTSLILLYRPVMAAGFRDWAGITIFTQGLFVLLAMGFVLLRWETLRKTLISTDWCSKICAGILLAAGLLHWLAGRFYNPEFLGMSLFWGMIPVFGAVYRNDLERKLPTVLGIFWAFNAIVCCSTETLGYEMFGITGNWNWSAMLMLISFPFALRCIPQYCKGRNIYLTLMWIVTLVLSVYLQSRAMVLSAAATGVFWVFLKYRKLRIPLVAGFAVLLIAGWFMAVRVFPERTEKFLKQEIRTELWKGTVNLIRDYPTGVGVVTFEDSFIPYRSIEYFKHRHAALRDNHPHNELLYLAATLSPLAAAAFIFWIINMLIAAVREYDTGTMSRKRVLFLLGFIAIMCSSMLDLTLQIWPVGSLGMLFFGMFAFPGKRLPQMTTDGPANRIGKTVIGFTVLLALANMVGTFYWEASHNAVKKMDIPTAKAYAEKAMLFAPEFPHLLYRSAMEMSQRDRDFALKLAERMELTPWKNYAHIHGLKAMLFALKGENEKAIEEYLLDAECYPLQILPCIGILTAYGRMGRKDLFPLIEEELLRRIKERNLTSEQIKEIYKNPKYDLHPEWIGEKENHRQIWQPPL